MMSEAKSDRTHVLITIAIATGLLPIWQVGRVIEILL
jgi:hypothetical protein